MIPLRDRNPSETIPIVNISLILVNVIVFFFELQIGGFDLGGRDLQRFFYLYGFVPEQFERASSVYSIFTSMFLHGSWMHIVGNMLYLWIFGDNVENLLGHARYLVFYLISGVAAGLTHVFFAVNFSPASLSVPMIGASGAISGVLGAYIMRYPRARVLVLIPIFYFITLREIPAVLVLGIWFVLQLFSGVGSLGVQEGGGVAFWAHVGGFVAGAVLIHLFAPRRRRAI